MKSNDHDNAREQPRTELRKIQVLDAATECFRLYGFHNTSMAQISKAARMSVGHIYHYFENKEAIISAIVDRELQQLQTIIRNIREGSEGGDLLRATFDETYCCIQDIANDKNVPLILEIIAEAARNPAVAAIVQKSDLLAMSYFKALIRDGLKQRCISYNEQDLNAPLEVISAMYEGISIRLIRNPKLDIAAVNKALVRTMEYVIEEMIAKSPAAR